MLDDGTPGSGPAHYALETLLSTAGIPYGFARDLPEATDEAGARCVHLVIGPVEDPRMDGLARESAVAVLPAPQIPAISYQLSAISTQDSGLRTQDPPQSSVLSPQSSPRNPEPRTHAPDPAQIKILRQATPSGYLVGIAGDLVGASFALLSRAEEYGVAARDEHDRFLWAHSSIRPAELATRPLVSEYAQLLLACLKEACTRAQVPLIRKEFWPVGKPMAGCLTHDVDVVRRGKLPRGVAVRDVRGALSSAAHGRLRQATRRVATIARTAAGGRDPYWTFSQILALEKRHDYRSTFYFMTGRHHPEDGSYDLDSPSMAGLLRTLADSGCEMGLHGSYASYGDAEALRSQKSDLERRLGREVAGHRNHFLRFRVPDSWRAQEAAGFSYDATLGFADREGFRGAHAFPFHPYDLPSGRVLDLQEIPLGIMDVSLLKYRRLRGEKGGEAIRGILEQTLAVNGLATLLWHNDTFYDPEYPGSARWYEAALDWLTEKDAYVAPAQEIDRWWRARAVVRLLPLAEGRSGWRMDAPQEIAGLVLRISLPDPQSYLRVRGQVPLAVKRDGLDYLLEFGLLPAGFSMDIEYA